MDGILGSISVVIVCGSVGVLLFVLMHMLAGSSPTGLHDEVEADVLRREEEREARDRDEARLSQTQDA